MISCSDQGSLVCEQRRSPYCWGNPLLVSALR